MLLRYQPLLLLGVCCILLLTAGGAGARADEADKTVEVSLGDAAPPLRTDEGDTSDVVVAPQVIEAPPLEEPLPAGLEPQANIDVLALPDFSGRSCLEILRDLEAAGAVDGPALSLDEAMARAVENNPELLALALEVDAELAGQVQAFSRESPTLEIGLSEFFGQNDRRGFRQSVSSVTYSKVIEDSCKRAARLALSRSEVELARWDFEARLRDIQRDVARAYVEVLIAQNESLVQRELLRLSEALRNDVALRFEAGTVPQLDLNRIDIEIAGSRIALGQAEREYDSARRRLAALWGSLVPDFARVEGSVTDVVALPSIERLSALLGDNPALLRFDRELARREAERALAFAEGLPDYEVSGGVEGFGESGEMALQVGVTVPLNRGNRNQGLVREAEVRIGQLTEQQGSIQRGLLAELVDAAERLASAHALAEAICSEVIPAAQDAYEKTVIGYRFGKFDYVEVLQSERTLFSAMTDYIDALADYQRARVDVERLIARPLGEALSEDAAVPSYGELEAVPPGDPEADVAGAFAASNDPAGSFESEAEAAEGLEPAAEEQSPEPDHNHSREEFYE